MASTVAWNLATNSLLALALFLGRVASVASFDESRAGTRDRNHPEVGPAQGSSVVLRGNKSAVARKRVSQPKVAIPAKSQSGVYSSNERTCMLISKELVAAINEEIGLRCSLRTSTSISRRISTAWP